MRHARFRTKFSICNLTRASTTMPLQHYMERTVKIALVGAGMFGGDVHARAYADLQRSGISPQLGRVGLDHWARDFADIKFELVAVATRSESSARRAQKNYKQWTKAEPKAFWGEKPWREILKDI